MISFKIFCLTIYNKNYDFFNKLGFAPVGLGPNKYNNDWLLDNSGKNISNKNKFYGEYTFHYWLWQNYLNNLSNNKWVGFCTYRRFWTLRDCQFENLDIFKNNIITTEQELWKNSEVVLAEKLSINRIKKTKIIKKFGIKNTILNYKILLKKKHNLIEHFKIFHGNYHINEAIKLLPKKDKYDFEEYLQNFSFNPHNLFICRGSRILEEFYSNVFSWLFRCEDKFNMNKLNGYEIRMLGFLAEHFVSYWFHKNFSVYENPITFYDTNKKLP